MLIHLTLVFLLVVTMEPTSDLPWFWVFQEFFHVHKIFFQSFFLAGGKESTRDNPMSPTSLLKEDLCFSFINPKVPLKESKTFQNILCSWVVQESTQANDDYATMFSVIVVYGRHDSSEREGGRKRRFS